MKRLIFCVTSLLIALLSLPLQSYTIGSGGYKWRTTPTFYVSRVNYSNLSPSVVEAATHAGIQAWKTIQSSFNYNWGGLVGDTNRAYDGRSVVVFVNSANPTTPKAVATTYKWIRTINGVAQLYDMDIVMWDGPYTFYAGTSGCSGLNAYVEDITAHEYGHAIGFDHSTVAYATMYSPYQACKTWMRDLAADDVAGLHALYP